MKRGPRALPGRASCLSRTAGSECTSRSSSSSYERITLGFLLVDDLESLEVDDQDGRSLRDSHLLCVSRRHTAGLTKDALLLRDVLYLLKHLEAVCELDPLLLA